MNEQNLLERALQLERDAFGQIFDSHFDAIYRYIYFRVRHKETAEDLTQEVFKRLVDAFGKERGPNRNLKSWLYRVARNLIIDEARSQTIRQHEPLDETLPQADADVSTQANRAILTATIREAIEKLTRKQKDVIVLKFLQGLTTGEIADVLRISERGVLKLQQRGIATMRTHLALNSALDEELV